MNDQGSYKYDQAARDDWYTRYLIEKKEREKARIKKIRKIAKVCHEAGICGVAVTYAGSGDSGCVESTWVVKKIDDIDNITEDNFDEVGNNKLKVMPVPESIDEKDASIYSAMLDYVGDLLADFAPDGYENNEGGQGTVLLDCENAEVKTYHGNNVVEVEYETYSFDTEETDEKEAK